VTVRGPSFEEAAEGAQSVGGVAAPAPITRIGLRRPPLWSGSPYTRAFSGVKRNVYCSRL
jgi:hypothetical protein